MALGTRKSGGGGGSSSVRPHRNGLVEAQKEKEIVVVDDDDDDEVVVVGKATSFHEAFQVMVKASDGGTSSTFWLSPINGLERSLNDMAKAKTLTAKELDVSRIVMEHCGSRVVVVVVGGGERGTTCICRHHSSWL